MTCSVLDTRRVVDFQGQLNAKLLRWPRLAEKMLEMLERCLVGGAGYLGSTVLQRCRIGLVWG